MLSIVKIANKRIKPDSASQPFFCKKTKAQKIVQLAPQFMRALYANMNSNFVPQNKHDLDACINLKALSNSELSSHFEQLLPWLQDMNWPVAISVAEKLSQANVEIVPFINEVLAGDDDIWKCNIIEHLIMKLKPDVMEKSLAEVVRIINSPSP